MLPELKRILLVRTDRVGDLVLTTPAFAALRAKYPQAEITALVNEACIDLVKGSRDLNRTIALSSERHGGFLGFFRLLWDIRKAKYQAAVVFQTNFKVALAIFFGGVRFRFGPLSKWWSWVIYNWGRRQNRSAVEMHEADYNIQLLRDFGITVAQTRQSTHLPLSKGQMEFGRAVLAERGMSDKYKTVIIHPGMGGSALNWPESHFIRLGGSLLQRFNVLVTGGLAEAPLVDRVMQGISQKQSYQLDRPVLGKYIGETSLADFIGVISECDGMVAASTGPMHLAVALGKKVVTVFSPIRVQSAVRWGPYGVASGTNLGVSPQDSVSVLVPDVNCAENYKCALSACIYYPCMPRIPVEDVETQLLVLLEGGELSMFKNSGFSGYTLEDNYGESDL